MNSSYMVLRAFRVPRDGGRWKPYRYYEPGVGLTADDIKVWGEDASIDQLMAAGFVEQTAPAPEPQPSAENHS